MENSKPEVGPITTDFLVAEEMLITKIFTFAGAHQLPNHPGKCKNLHGHEWKLEVTISGQIDADTGMIIDFSDLKKIVNENVIDVLDHSYLNNTLPNPTAENIISWIWDKLEDKVKNKRRNLFALKLWEAPDSCIEYAKVYQEVLNK